jgi:pimeloyl-ACP methyl ester carboxylesterase
MPRSDSHRDGVFYCMKKSRLIKISLLSVMLIFFSGCFLLNKYVFTDKELDDFYKDKKIKPVYKRTGFLDRSMHYAVISKSDTLPLLMLVHGAPGAWYGYMNMMSDSLLQQKFKIISVDRLGYGKSGYGKAELSVQLQALAIKRVMDVENKSGKKVYLLGRSYGAPIAAWLAINYPQQVEKLFMISPVIDPEREKFYWFSNIGKWRVVQWFLPRFLNVATAEKFSHASQMKLLLPKWKRLYVPTYVMVGENDHIADTANFSFAKKYIINANALFLKVKNSGHLVTRDQPQLIEQLLLEKP